MVTLKTASSSTNVASTFFDGIEDVDVDAVDEAFRLRDHRPMIPSTGKSSATSISLRVIFQCKCGKKGMAVVDVVFVFAAVVDVVAAAVNVAAAVAVAVADISDLDVDINGDVINGNLTGF